jgi:Smg protein
MIDVIMYLFEHYMEKDAQIRMADSQLSSELQRVGYKKVEIEYALDWLKGLNQPCAAFSDSAVVRIYHPVEKRYLTEEGIKLLSHLEQAKILTAIQREIVIDRAMALGSANMDYKRLRWIILMVLFAHDKDKQSLIWMQDFILSTNKVKH